MKKLLIILLALALTSCVSASANLDPSNKSGDVTITATVNVGYVVTIPSDTSLTFGDLSTDIGDIAVTDLVLAPNTQLTVTISGVTSAGAGTLTTSASGTIPFILKIGATASTTAANATATNTTSFTANGTKPVYIDIAQAAWDAAPAGSYSDTITFAVSVS